MLGTVRAGSLPPPLLSTLHKGSKHHQLHCGKEVTCRPSDWTERATPLTTCCSRHTERRWLTLALAARRDPVPQPRTSSFTIH
ncbi:hypothetical protein E2C01_007006 [Portunus trituberculatus]|uniref:Uncharacterized protein n=1 Tax=Portunus trituberculatus TaxID=210409 RepID=A0A5B7D182_PORTR|nr:hypothetical protein [Portunus trituberculatus]